MFFCFILCFPGRNVNYTRVPNLVKTSLTLSLSLLTFQLTNSLISCCVHILSNLSTAFLLRVGVLIFSETDPAIQPRLALNPWLSHWSFKAWVTTLSFSHWVIKSQLWTSILEFASALLAHWWIDSTYSYCLTVFKHKQSQLRPGTSTHFVDLHSILLFTTAFLLSSKAWLLLYICIFL